MSRLLRSSVVAAIAEQEWQQRLYRSIASEPGAGEIQGRRHWSTLRYDYPFQSILELPAFSADNCIAPTFDARICRRSRRVVVEGDRG